MKVLSGVALVGALLLWAWSGTQAQFKGQVDRDPETSGGLIAQPSPSLFFGWFDPNRFSMSHTVEVSYGSYGGTGMTLGTYTNSMRYQFADNLDARADVSMSFSPSNSLSSFGAKGGKDISSIYLSRAQLSYRPWENVVVQVQYRQLPYGYYNSPFMNPMFGGY